MEKWRIIRSELVLDGKWAKVRRDICATAKGTEVDDYYYWEGSDFAQVFALTCDGRVILVRQYKHAVKDIVLELPAGLVSAGDESPLETARRELSEETGFRASRWEALGELNVSSAKATTQAYLFLAAGAEHLANPELDANEDIELVLVTIPELLGLITRGQVRDSSSVACSLLALESLGWRTENSGRSWKEG